MSTHRERASKRNENKNVLKALKGETLMLVNNFFSFFSSFLTVGGKTFIVVCLMMSCSNKKKEREIFERSKWKNRKFEFLFVYCELALSDVFLRYFSMMGLLLLLCVSEWQREILDFLFLFFCAFQKLLLKVWSDRENWRGFCVITVIVDGYPWHAW